MITLENVTYVYDMEDQPERKALDNVTFSVNKGEFLGIIGHNGSGKSTLAKLLNGLLLPTEGEVKVLGLSTGDEENLYKIRQNVGMVFQNPDNQMVATIVEEDVAFGVENLGVDPKEIRTRVDDALKAVDMYEFRNKKPHQLSGGQKQRIAIAGILAMKPDCIIFDESTAMLDPQGRNEVLHIIEKLNKEDGVTIVFITHYMEELVNADRIIIMQEGRIIMEDSPVEIFSRTEELKRLRLNVPEVVEIANGLRRAGLNIKNDVLTAEELVDALCQFK